MSTTPHGTAVVIGLGLIGASFAGALRKTGFFVSVIGVEVSPEARTRALADGLVDAVTEDAEEAIRGARVVVLATHVGHLLESIAELGPRLPEGALLLDVGSTKEQVIAAMNALPDGTRAVGGHPMTGRRSAGVAGPNAGLFAGKPFFLVPSRHSTEEVLGEAEALVVATGARPFVVDATRHDRLVGLVSHLPRLLPVALALAAENAGDPLLWQVAAGGFREAVRPAAGDVAMWRDVLITNPEGVAAAVRLFADELSALAAKIESGDAAALEEALSRAAGLVASPLGEKGGG